MFCKSFRKALIIQRQNQVHNQSEDLSFFFNERLVLGTKIVKNSLVQSEELFFLETTSFGDRNFRTILHNNITLIVSAIATRDKLRDENLACDEKKVEHPWGRYMEVRFVGMTK